MVEDGGIVKSSETMQVYHTLVPLMRASFAPHSRNIYNNVDYYIIFVSLATPPHHSCPFCYKVPYSYNQISTEKQIKMQNSFLSFHSGALEIREI